MRFLISFFFFVYSLYAGCSNTKPWVVLSVNNYDYTQLNSYAHTDATIWQCGTYVGGLLTAYLIFETYGADNSAGTGYRWHHQVKYSLKESTTSSCPIPQVVDSNGVCQDPPPPVTCSWATTPPYYSTTRDQSTCNNAFKGGSLLEPYYLWNFSWCTADTTCYGRKYWCPAGQYFDPNIESCRDPKPSTRNCTAGFYKICGSVTSNGTKNCFCDYVCKTNPNDRTRYEVSCGAGPVDDQPLTNPDAPNEVPSDNPDQKATNSDNTGNCFASESVARINCIKPNVLSFQCDPTTGKVTKNECKAPTVPTDTQKNTGDDTKSATTEDIKDLSNTLPKNIRDALSDFFTDGSMPHLEAIRGTLQANLLLDADRNDKLDAISASTDAGLVLQSDANDKLDGIKSSTDGVKTSIDTVNDTLNQGGNYNGADMPSASDLAPDSQISDLLSTFTYFFDQTNYQFDQAIFVFRGGVPSINFGSGSCPTYEFRGISVSLSRVGESIAPYSPIFSILIYIALMFRAFRLVFSFFTKGV